MNLEMSPALRFDAAAEEVAGVRALYAARPLAVRLAGQLADADPANSHVQEGPEGVDVTVSIGVDDSRDCADVAARVAAGVRAASPGVSVATVRVRVSRLIPEG
jgi:hypothetical protein